MKDKTWLKKPMRISAVQCNLGENSDDIFRDFTVDFGFNVEQLNHLFKKDFQGDFTEEEYGEKLDRYLKIAHEAGVKEIIYYCLHALDGSAQYTKPDWVQRYRDGRVIPVYDSQVLGCPNSGWRDDCIKRLADLARHDVDGIFLDGPLFYINGCYCESCRKKFRGIYGKDMEDASFKEYLDFRTDEITRFIKDIREAVDAVNPNLVIYLNNSALRADITGSNTRRLNKYVDIIGAEGGFFVVHKTQSLYVPSAMAKDIECKAEGKPTVIFIAGDSKPNSYYMHTPVETARVFAQSVSNGANVWYGLHGFTRLKNEAGGQAARKFLHFLKDNEKYYTDTRSAAKIALVWSTDTANYYSSNVAASDFTGDGTAMGKADKNRCDHYAEFLGCYEMLAQNHVQFDVADEHTLENGLDRYDLIVLPCVACMTDKAVESVKSFVRRGGNVIATMETGSYDEFGSLRDYDPFKEVFGAERREIVRTYEGICYQHRGKELWESVPEILPAATIFERVGLAGGTTESLRYPDIAGRYERIGSPDPATPAVVKNTYGKGTAVLFTGGEGSYYNEWHDGNKLRVFGRYVRSLGEPQTETDALKCVEITLRRKADGYVLHLINLAVNAYRPMEELIPLPAFSVRVKGAGGLKAVPVTDTKISAARDGDDLVVKIDRLDLYAAISLE